MKNVRIKFTKTGNAKFFSHLDLTRLMSRLIRKANIDIWYTEGFNPHPYITFALPLPLGFEGYYEIMDIRLNNDDADLSEILYLLNSVSPDSIRFINIAEPISKTSEVAFAEYEIIFDDNGEIKDNLNTFLKSRPILCRKKTKKGDFKEIDLSLKIKSSTISSDDKNSTVLKLILPAGSKENVNPILLLDTYFGEFAENYCFYSIKRLKLLNDLLDDFV